MLTVDPYRAYEESSFAGSNPVNLVVALYEGALASTRNAKACLESGDIMARGKAITKTVSIVSELLSSLDHEKGGEVSANLQRIYFYLHKRLIEAHAKQRREPLDEVESLLSTLLTAWKKVAAEQAVSEQSCADWQPSANTGEADTYGFPYGGYFVEAGDGSSTISVAC